MFLNAGDSLYAEDTIEKVVSAASLQPSAFSPQPSDISKLPAVVYGDTATTDSEGRFLHLRRHRPPKTLTWRSFKKGMLVCHQAFYARLDIARRFPYNLKFRHSADVDWCIRIMKEAERLRLPLVNVNTLVANFEEGGHPAPPCLALGTFPRDGRPLWLRPNRTPSWMVRCPLRLPSFLEVIG